MAYLYLAIAIVAEVIGTSFMKVSAGFTRPGPAAITIVAYAIAFYALSLTLRTIPTGVAYAIWSGVGDRRLCDRLLRAVADLANHTDRGRLCDLVGRGRSSPMRSPSTRCR